MLLTEKYKKQIYYQFPKDFLWGVAMSAKQAEGADDRALTVADLQNYDPNDKAKVKGDLSKAEILDRLNYPERYNFPKKIGIEFYHRYKEDLILLKEMGITCFRFSISWARVFPNGIDGEPSEKGLKYYDKIIYVFLTIFLYLLKCPQSLILSALRAFCFCGKPHISRSIFLYFRYQAWLKSW